MSIFTDVCWRHWPKGCACPPSASEIERMRSDVFLLDRELQRENRRAREFADALASLSKLIWMAREKRMTDGGEDNVPADLHELAEQAKQAADLLTEPRNEDRVAGLYEELERPGVAQEQGEKHDNQD